MNTITLTPQRQLSASLFPCQYSKKMPKNMLTPSTLRQGCQADCHLQTSPPNIWLYIHMHQVGPLVLAQASLGDDVETSASFDKRNAYRSILLRQTMIQRRSRSSNSSKIGARTAAKWKWRHSPGLALPASSDH